MDPIVAGSLISAGSNFIGGLFGQSSQSKANKMAVKAAKNQIAWRVKDAKRAGVHPLYALGAPTMSLGSVVGDTSMQSAMSNIGQDISRAMAATSTSQDRMDSQVKALTLTRMGLENELLGAQIAKTKQGIGPAFPGSPTVIPGQGDVPVLEVNPPSRTSHFVTPQGKIVKTYNTPDAQIYEDRYGELGGGVYGVRNWLYDNFPGVMEAMNKKVVVRGRRPPWK